jgi:hypothetical protein
MKAANSASIQLAAAVIAIIGSIAGTAIGGANWLNGKFAAQDTRISEMAKEHGQRTAEMQRQIDALRAALQAMSVTQPRPTRELVRDLMVTKAARLPGKGISSDELRMKSAAHD